MRMKTVKSIIRLLTVVLICISLTACVGKNKELPKQEPSQDERDSELYDPYFTDETQKPVDDGGESEREREIREREKNGDQDRRIGASEEDDGGESEREREIREREKEEQRRREEEERRQQEEEEPEPDDCIGPELIGYPIDVPDEERDDDGQDEPEPDDCIGPELIGYPIDVPDEERDDDGQDEPEPEPEPQPEPEPEPEPQQQGGYEHHVGDAVFYTEHDLWKYISPNPADPIYNLIDIQAMLVDVWGTEGTVGSVANDYVLYDGSSLTAGVMYFNVDDNIANKRMVVSSSVYDNDGEHQYRSVVTSWNTRRPDGGYWVVKGDSRGFGMTQEMAAIFLYMLEQTKSNPRGNIAGELGLPSNFECTY